MPLLGKEPCLQEPILGLYTGLTKEIFPILINSFNPICVAMLVVYHDYSIMLITVTT